MFQNGCTPYVQCMYDVIQKYGDHCLGDNVEMYVSNIMSYVYVV